MTALAVIGLLALLAIVMLMTFVFGMGAGMAYSAKHPEKVFKHYGAILSTPALLVAGRIGHVKTLCQHAMDFDALPQGELSNRAWLAQSVLNILDGSIDPQITAEISR